MPAALPTRAPGDLGAALSNVRTPVANELSAVNVERIKDRIIEIATEIGLLDGSTVGSIWEAIDGVQGGALLYEMPINVASVGTPRRMNTAGGSFTSSVSPASAVVSSLALPSRQALSLTATVQGGWVWPVLHGLTLPTDGYILDVEIDVCGGSGGWDACICPMLDLVEPTPGNPTVAGMQLLSRVSSTNMQPSIMAPTTGYVSPSSPFLTLGGWSTAPSIANTTKGPMRMVIEVRRVASQTPARWAIVITTYSSSTGSTVVRNAFSCGSDPQSGLDGRPLATFGLGMWVDGGGAIAVQLSIARLRVFSLDR